VIETAADHRQTSLRWYLDGKHGVEAKALFKEVAEAKVCLFLVVAYVDGLYLGDILRHCGLLLIPDAAHLVYQTALALHSAHTHGPVHRDIKPSNLMLTASATVKLIDQGAPGDEMTASGQAMGTIDYVAPEQVADSRHVDIRADIYALGSTFYKLLTSQTPSKNVEPAKNTANELAPGEGSTSSRKTAASGGEPAVARELNL
jgi:serine/threonine protein kinase